jgi:amino acid adenylation domain-containing protein
LATVKKGLWAGFIRSAEIFAERPAIVVDGSTISYRDLREIATRIAATIQAHPELSRTPLTAVFAYRSATAFAGVLGALLAGNGYVPLNRTFPIARTESMSERSGCQSIVVDRESLPNLYKLLDQIKKPLLVISPELEDPGTCRKRWPQHVFMGADDLEPSIAWEQPPARPNAIAYLLFTSGSTGIPKGVMVAHRNVAPFIDYMIERFKVTEYDIMSQMFDMTFDLSVFDMFVAWEVGACVCCPSQKVLFNPGNFIRDVGLTIWFSVPSTVSLMKQMKLLKPGKFPSLRLSLFCGEPLPVASATAWSEAAPNSILENLYGPTELTIACTHYRWDPKRSSGECELGIVPIGCPFPGMNVLVVDEGLNEVSPGERGQLLISGPQTSLGYWKDPDKTAASFIIPPGKAERFYQTGDYVRRPANNGPLTYHGRLDFQIKVRGHRVELGEIEPAVREASGSHGVVAVGWPFTSSGCGGIEVFIEGAAYDIGKLRTEIARRLPDYMVPKRFHVMGRLPRNANDKFDRTAMLRMLGEGL